MEDVIPDRRFNQLIWYMIVRYVGNDAGRIEREFTLSLYDDKIKW